MSGVVALSTTKQQGQTADSQTLSNQQYKSSCTLHHALSSKEVLVLGGPLFAQSQYRHYKANDGLAVPLQLVAITVACVAPHKAGKKKLEKGKGKSSEGKGKHREGNSR